MSASAKGMRAMMGRREGEESVVSGEPERAANVANRVVGRANVAKSLAVKR